MNATNMLKAAIATATFAAISIAPVHAQPLQFDYHGTIQIDTHDTMFFTLDSELKNVFLTGEAHANADEEADFAIWKDDQVLASFRYDSSSSGGDRPGFLLGAPLAAGNYALTVSQYRPAGIRLSEWIDKPAPICPWVHCTREFDWSASVSGDSVGIPAVPEPGTYAMLLAGLGLTGLALRRKRRLS